MYIPDSIIIGGMKVKINLVNTMPDGNNDLGQWCDETYTISINKNAAPETQLSTLYHELLHGVLYISGWSSVLTTKNEEGIVLAMEHIYVPLIKELLEKQS